MESERPSLHNACQLGGRQALSGQLQRGGRRTLNGLVMFWVALDGFTRGAFDFAFFLFVSHPRKPLTPPLIRMSHLAVFPTP